MIKVLVLKFICLQVYLPARSGADLIGVADRHIPVHVNMLRLDFDRIFGRLFRHFLRPDSPDGDVMTGHHEPVEALPLISEKYNILLVRFPVVKDGSFPLRSVDRNIFRLRISPLRYLLVSPFHHDTAAVYRHCKFLRGSLLDLLFFRKRLCLFLGWLLSLLLTWFLGRHRLLFDGFLSRHRLLRWRRLHWLRLGHSDILRFTRHITLLLGVLLNVFIKLFRSASRNSGRIQLVKNTVRSLACVRDFKYRVFFAVPAFLDVKRLRLLFLRYFFRNIFRSLFCGYFFRNLFLFLSRHPILVYDIFIIIEDLFLGSIYHFVSRHFPVGKLPCRLSLFGRGGKYSPQGNIFSPHHEGSLR